MCLPQIRVRAYRQSTPTVQAFKTITVNVDRNPTAPRFPQQNYEFTIPESQVLGQTFGSVNATDPDAVSVCLT